MRCQYPDAEDHARRCANGALARASQHPGVAERTNQANLKWQGQVPKTRPEPQKIKAGELLKKRQVTLEAGQFAGATIVMPGAGTGAGAQMTKNAEMEHDANSCRTRALHAGLESESLPGACTLL